MGQRALLVAMAFMVLLAGTHAAVTYTPPGCAGGSYNFGLLDGLAAYFPMEGTANSVAPGAAMPFNLAGSPTFPAGVAGQAVAFVTQHSGSSPPPTTVMAAHRLANGEPVAEPLLWGESGTTSEYVKQATISLWVKLVDIEFSGGSESNARMGLFCPSRGITPVASNEGMCIMLGMSGGNVRVIVIAADTVVFSSDINIDRNSLLEWTQLTVTWKRASETAANAGFVYINGTVHGGVVNTLNNIADTAQLTPTEFVLGQNDRYFSTSSFPAGNAAPLGFWGPTFTSFRSEVWIDNLAMWNRELTAAEISLLTSDLNPIASSSAGSCSCNSGSFYNATALACVPCESPCAECSGSATSCTACLPRFENVPTCSLSCASKCAATKCTVADENECTECTAGFANAPACAAICASQCATCLTTNGTSCETCAAGLINPPGCSDPAPPAGSGTSPAATPALADPKSSSSVALYAGIGGGLLLFLVVAIVVLLFFKWRNKSVDFAALMCPPLASDGWARMFPRWNEPMFEGVAATSGSSARYAPMEGVVATDPLSLPLYMALADVVPKRNLYSAVVAAMAVTQEHNLTLSLLKALVEHEVAVTLNAETLFRQNSAATKLFQAWGKLRAVEYVRQTIGVLVLECLYQYNQVHSTRNKEGGDEVELDGGYTGTAGLEVDPTRLTDADSLDVNKYKLMTTCQTFLESIYRSSGRCPSSLKEVLSYVATTVGTAYPSKEVQGMGGFFFLRLFCPAITSPQEYLISRDEVSRDERRYLVLVAKVIQNAANGVKFGKKEEFMVQLNDLVESNIPKIENFFTQSLFAGSDAEAGSFAGPTDANEPVPAMVRYNALATLHTMVAESSQEILTWLDEHPVEGADIARMQVAAIMALPAPPAPAART
ncbi:uncharacterized protein AMSG_10622 [Thecamonas trahens ATCC 50062]|uniref:Ras-GAP domain-containing protein n=1 Tax=Thecamonas trahens ATCC 50062 TaxID=461836 RepID=A0A0L0DU59_THETB|nr:hypothetical protein AMSG_10622 [Thecamonas trahens ATCC 50062]KNC55028.1 hypothetical protein AMSG_10622 [Thecamonas trahens ATCC 50062]|eukprot:XP_013753334.1 hypothetical protein AMSG_10622 [Thecamonas trahens ATCC 50062]